MRFGGHETFAVREGWLPKGLALINENPTAFSDQLVGDSLGVGRNMAKSILYWLTVTGLVLKRTKSQNQSITPLGKMVIDKDPSFLQIGTWWALHVNLVGNGTWALAWHWFFSDFYYDRFDRIRCVEGLKRWTEAASARVPSIQTIARDIACVLASYAIPVPPEYRDPEDGYESPFRLLEILTHFRETDTYKFNMGMKNIPPEIVGLALVKPMIGETEGGYIDIPLSDALSKPGFPGKTLVLNSDTFSGLLNRTEKSIGKRLLRTHMIGSERSIQVKNLPSELWLEKYYTNSSKQ